MPQSSRIPSYRLHKPSGQARVIIGGRHHYLGPYGSPESKARYEELVRKFISDHAAEEMKTRALAHVWGETAGAQRPRVRKPLVSRPFLRGRPPLASRIVVATWNGSAPLYRGNYP